MARQSEKGTQPAEDGTVLRAGLVQLLDLLADRAVSSEAKEIRSLTRRLRKGAVPTGLSREITRIFSQSAQDIDAAAAFSETALAMGDAMSQVAMSERDLERSIMKLQASVPARVDISHARKLTAKARALREAAAPIRRRVLNAHGETAMILEAVSQALAGTVTTSGRISRNAGRLARTFAETHDAEALRSMRSQIIQALEALAKDANKLEIRMSSTRARTKDLERRIEKQAAILGVLDSCRRIRKNLEHYGDDQEQVIEPVKTLKGLWDPLTGVYSRETHDRLILRAVRACNDGHQPLSLVLVVVDNLALLTERYGETARNTVLKTLGRQLTEVVEETDVLSRIEDDTFALLLPKTAFGHAHEQAIKARSSLRRVTFASHVGRFNVTLRSSAVEYRQDETVGALEARGKATLNPESKAKKR